MWFRGCDEKDIPITILQIIKTGLNFTPLKNSQDIDQLCCKRNELEEYIRRESTSPLKDICQQAKFWLKRHHLKVLETDKNMGPIILSVSLYEKLAQKILLDETTFKYLYDNTEEAIIREYKRDLEKLMPDALLNLCTPKTEEKIPQFMGAPKVHKPVLALRPIINAKDTYTTKIAVILDKCLKIILKDVHKQNTFNVNKIEDYHNRLKNVPLDTTKVRIDALDIKSLYTNIPCDLIYEALDWALTVYDIFYIQIYHDKRYYIISRFEVESMIKLYSKFNTLKYENKIYRQLVGIPTGGNASPNIAILALSFMEITCLNTKRIATDHYLLSGRYLDDWLIITTDPEYDHTKFQKMMYGTTFILEESDKDNISKPFLDCQFFISDNQLHWRLYRKPGNAYAYIHYKSHIPDDTKKGFIIGEIIRIHRRSSKPSYITPEIQFFKERLYERGYNKQFIDGAINEAKRRLEIGNEQPKKNKDSTTWIPTPYLQNTSKTIILQKYKDDTVSDQDHQICWTANKKIKSCI